MSAKSNGWQRVFKLQIRCIISHAYMLIDVSILRTGRKTSGIFFGRRFTGFPRFLKEEDAVCPSDEMPD